MRKHRYGLALLLALVIGPRGEAGLYNLSEPQEGRVSVEIPGAPGKPPVPVPYAYEFRGTLFTLQSIASPKVDVDWPDGCIEPTDDARWIEMKLKIGFAAVALDDQLSQVA